ncbi:retrotransposon protein, putative, ty3-gypsy subclass [Tanacetum coccineum]
MSFEELIFSEDYNYSQDYSMGHGSGHGSAHGSAHGSVPVHDDEDESPVEEVSPVKPKKPSRHAIRAKKDEPKESPKDWTIAEKTALCQALYDVSENNIDGNSTKSKGFLDVVIRYFEKDTGSSSGYDSIVSKWKNRVRLIIGANVEENHESGANDLDVYHKACAEYKMMYKQDFTLEHCYNILKDHPGWKDIEMPAFYNTQGRKKSKTSETTSGSAFGGLNLNEKADEDMEETQKFRPIGRDRAKAKKKAAGSSRGGSSSLVDLVADKFFNIKQKNGERRMSNNSPI